MHLGRPWPQNAKGHLLGDVTDQGRAARRSERPGKRDRRSRVPVPLRRFRPRRLVLPQRGRERRREPRRERGRDPQRARARQQPELAAALYAPFAYDFRGEQAPGGKPWYTMPIFSRRGDRLFVRYIRPYIEAARRHEDAPRPSPTAREAMDRVDAMCADPQYHVSMMMQPGDMQFVNNYHVLHARATRTSTIAPRARSVTSSGCGWRPTCSPTATSPSSSGSAGPRATGGRARAAPRARSKSEARYSRRSWTRILSTALPISAAASARV